MPPHGRAPSAGASRDLSGCGRKTGPRFLIDGGEAVSRRCREKRAAIRELDPFVGVPVPQAPNISPNRSQHPRHHLPGRQVLSVVMARGRRDQADDRWRAGLRKAATAQTEEHTIETRSPACVRNGRRSVRRLSLIARSQNTNRYNLRVLLVTWNFSIRKRRCAAQAGGVDILRNNRSE